MNSMTDQPQALAGSQLRTPKQYELKGDIAISLAIHSGDFEGAKALLDLIVLSEPMNHIDLVLSIAGGHEVLDAQEWF